MNQLTIMTKAMIILAVSVLIVSAAMLNLGILYTDPNFAAKYYPYEIFLAFVVLALWYILLRKDLPLDFHIKFNKDFFITLPLFLIPFSLLIFVLFTSKNIDTVRLTQYVMTAAAVGIAEEMIFRVVVFRGLVTSGSSVKKAILISALLFSSFHLLNLVAGMELALMPIQLINTFMLGIVFVYIYYKTESILYIILLHFMWDLSSFSISAFGGQESHFTLYIFALSMVYFVWAIIDVLKLKKTTLKEKR